MATTKPAAPPTGQPTAGPYPVPLPSADDEPRSRLFAEMFPDTDPAAFRDTPGVGDIPVDVDVWADFQNVGDGGTTTTHDDLAWDGVDLDVGAQVVAGDCAGNRCPATVVARGEAGRVVLRLDRAAPGRRAGPAAARRTRGDRPAAAGRCWPPPGPPAAPPACRRPPFPTTGGQTSSGTRGSPG